MRINGTNGIDLQRDFEISKSMEILHRAAVEGMWPFKVKDVAVTEDYDIDNNYYRLLVEVLFGTQVEQMWPYFLYINRDELLDLGRNRIDTAISFGKDIVRHYRFAAGLPVGDNICLGEN